MTFTIAQARVQFDELLAKLVAGERVIITGQDNRPIVALRAEPPGVSPPSAPQEAAARKLGFARDQLLAPFDDGDDHLDMFTEYMPS